ncbi:SMI1/KNR4 family protein [Salinibacterium sp. M195]|uniref:SMI1/KNR4 family protein n=1 Tax=Salinibacterium sp. M195 TaxID=2583374 RepID=UPI001C62C4F4|nr:SMI1/KNR4 family protein [Salinibacterium sp. M195]QYH34944.1 hypothetical protein FFT87_02700 [Salinibacterium sp. M195]
MSAAEVREQLDRFEFLSNAHGHPTMSRVRGGLTADAIRHIEEEAGITLPNDAKAIWQWHNGSTDQSHPPPFWGFGYWFPDLKSAISIGRRDLDIRNSGDVNTYPDSTWLILGGGSVSVVIDITTPCRANSLAYVNEPTSSGEEYPVVTIADRIGWWCWAIEHHVYRATPTGEWQLDFTKLPTGPERHLM